MSYTEDTAQDLAEKALAEAEASGDPKIVDQIGEVLGASSQSLQEAYLTAVRVRRAEARVREMLATAAAKRGAEPEAAPADPPAEPDTPAPEDVKEPEKPTSKGW